MSEQLWYYIDNAQAQQGPITIPQLQAFVAAGAITPDTIVWTEALGDQWIPASNVEGLFPESVTVAPDPNTASIAVKAPSQMADAATIAEEIAHAAEPPAPAPVPAPTLRAPSAVAQQPQQPQAAPTTPMIPSTPTTQPVAGTAAPIPGMAAASPAVSPVAAAAPVATEAAAKKGVNVLGIILLLVGLGAAGYGGSLLSQEGGKGLCYGLLGGGGVVAILGLIMTLKGKKSGGSTIGAPVQGGFSALGGSAVSPAVSAAGMGIGGVTDAPGVMDASAPVIDNSHVQAQPAHNPAGTFDLSEAANVAPIPAGTAPVAIKANPLMPSNPAATAATKPSPFAGVHAATKPNPLLASGTVTTPQNRLNTTLPVRPATPPEDAAQG